MKINWFPGHMKKTVRQNGFFYYPGLRPCLIFSSPHRFIVHIRRSPSRTVSRFVPMFIRMKPSPSGPKSVPLFRPTFASYISLWTNSFCGRFQARKSIHSRKEASGRMKVISGHCSFKNCSAASIFPSR